ncbi:IS5 family transposase [Streptomyces sp. AP-93]|uniref:IS5 family transposase n=1 Tax=Streptomyces sp. AP-93 TaxID=2929048 RepID=UPI001FAFD69B|nr:IS5 family transposase [Streptomyces sp. AP-93]MCJ0875188.1 IS5 family transposase [Streptomyces sp. AP-93]
MERHSGLRDAAWEQIKDLLPRGRTRGGRWVDHRMMIDAVAWKYRTGAPWRDLPARFGPWQTVYNRFRRWARDGTWNSLLRELQAQADSAGEIDWLVSVDSTVVRAHQHAAGARIHPETTNEPADHGLGRSRGGLTTKIHLAADGRCRPLAILISAGHRHDSLFFEAVIARIRVPRTGAGRPRTRPRQVSADRAYSSRAIRQYLRKRGIKALIPEPSDQAANRKRRGRNGGRPPAFDRDGYKIRNTVERCIGRMKQWRGIAMRTDKLATHYEAAVVLAATMLWTMRR